MLDDLLIRPRLTTPSIDTSAPTIISLIILLSTEIIVSNYPSISIQLALAREWGYCMYFPCLSLNISFTFSRLAVANVQIIIPNVIAITAAYFLAGYCRPSRSRFMASEVSREPERKMMCSGTGTWKFRAWLLITLQRKKVRTTGK